MLALTLNPGFVPIIVGLVVLAAPRGVRAFMMAGAALLALWLLLDSEFGAAAALGQMGLSVVPLDLDALNRIFGVAMLMALIPLAIYSRARRNRYEDAAILVLAGGAVSALFVGDIVSFVAAAALAGLAAAWTVFASLFEGANRSGVRLLIWHGLEGLLFLVGAALYITAQPRAQLTRMDVSMIGGACIFAALMIRVGAPMAHVWFKDVVSHASSTGGAALSCFTTTLGVYALARLFPAEPLLVPIGAAMIVIGALYAAADDDLRRAGAYAQTAHNGICVALIGVGSPLALAAAEGHAFATLLAFAGLQMTLGGLVERTGGSARVSQLTGMPRIMPVTSYLVLIGGLAVSATPGFVTYATQAVALEATARWDLRALWALIAGLSGVLFVSLALRPTLAIHRPAPRPGVRDEARFTMLLGAALTSFLCLLIGLAPRWLYDLTPAELAFQPFAADRIAPQLELLGVCGLAFMALRFGAGVPSVQWAPLLDIDALYRGPVTAAGRWAGVVMLRLYGAWHSVTARTSKATAARVGTWASACDRPFVGAGVANVAQFLSIGAVLLLILLFI